MFREDYKSAYGKIEVKEVLKQRMFEAAEEERRIRRKRPVVRAVTALAAACVCLFVVVPVGAANIPAFYKVIEHISPELANTLVPIEKSSESQGIIMSVEAVNVEENAAEIIVSFADAEGFDRIHGKVDMYDSYSLVSYDGKNNIGGCSFLKYDEENDKAYFKVDLSADEDFDKTKLTFRVRELLCDLTKEQKAVGIPDYDSLLQNGLNTKAVSINGGGRSGDSEETLEKYKEYIWAEGTLDDPRPRYSVLDAKCEDVIKTDDLVVTGMACNGNLFRVQVCRGDITKSDRHINWKLFDNAGNEIGALGNVGWFEEINGKRYAFDETWFEIDKEKVDEYQLVGMFYESEGSVKGNWKVTFELE